MKILKVGCVALLAACAYSINASAFPGLNPVAVINHGPVAATVPCQVTFGGANSYDPDGTIAEYTWQFVLDAQLRDVVKGISVSKRFEEHGQWQVILTVKDNSGAIRVTSKFFTFSKPGTPPIAILNATTLTGYVPLQITFDATASTDPDGTIVSYMWDFGNGEQPVSNGTGRPVESPGSLSTSTVTTIPDPVKVVTKSFNVPGTYNVTLTLTDNSGHQAMVQKKVIVEDQMRSPLAILNASADTGYAPLTVMFDASASSDADGRIVSYSWDLGVLSETPPGGRSTVPVSQPGSVPSALVSSCTVTKIYSKPGVYYVTVTVKDNDNKTSQDMREITVIDPNIRPVARLIVSVETGNAPLVVNFDASTSSDPDGTITLYEWDFGTPPAGAGPVGTRRPIVSLGSTSGAPSLNIRPSYTFSTPGSYTVKMTVTDNSGAKDIVSKVITVIDTNRPPVAQFTMAPSTGNAPLTVTFDGGGSNDPDGTIVSYDWEFGIADLPTGGTGTGRPTTSPGSGPGSGGSTTLPVVQTRTFDTPGLYQIKLKVTDNLGRTRELIQPLAVLDPNQHPVWAFSVTPPTGTAPLTATMDASGSTDADGSIASYTWAIFPDLSQSVPVGTRGHPGTTPVGTRTLTNSFRYPGNYLVGLKIVDDKGAQKEGEQIVTVGPISEKQVTVVKLSGTTGGAQSGTGVFRANLGFLGISDGLSLTIEDGGDMIDGASGKFSGFDLDAVILSTTYCGDAACVKGITSKIPILSDRAYYKAGSLIGNVDSKLHGTDATGGAIDHTVATLHLFDAISSTTSPSGFLSLGSRGEIAINFPSLINLAGMYLYVGEVGDNGESATFKISTGVKSERKVRQTIGPSGGTIATEAVRIFISPGAVNQNVTFTLNMLSDSTVSIAPHIQLAEPAHIFFTAPDTKTRSIVRRDFRNLTELPTTSYENIVMATTYGFSEYSYITDDHSTSRPCPSGTRCKVHNMTFSIVAPCYVSVGEVMDVWLVNNGYKPREHENSVAATYTSCVPDQALLSQMQIVNHSTVPCETGECSSVTVSIPSHSPVLEEDIFLPAKEYMQAMLYCDKEGSKVGEVYDRLLSHEMEHVSSHNPVKPFAAQTVELRQNQPITANETTIKLVAYKKACATYKEEAYREVRRLIDDIAPDEGRDLSRNCGSCEGVPPPRDNWRQAIDSKLVFSDPCTSSAYCPCRDPGSGKPTAYSTAVECGVHCPSGLKCFSCLCTPAPGCNR